MSPWYQAMPKGALGFWITKRSNSIFGGSPPMSTIIASTGPRDATLTAAWAFWMQLAATAPAERTIAKSILLVKALATGSFAPTGLSAATVRTGPPMDIPISASRPPPSPKNTADTFLAFFIDNSLSLPSVIDPATADLKAKKKGPRERAFLALTPDSDYPILDRSLKESIGP